MFPFIYINLYLSTYTYQRARRPRPPGCRELAQKLPVSAPEQANSLEMRCVGGLNLGRKGESSQLRLQPGTEGSSRRACIEIVTKPCQCMAILEDKLSSSCHVLAQGAFLFPNGVRKIASAAGRLPGEVPCHARVVGGESGLLGRHPRTV